MRKLGAVYLMWAVLSPDFSMGYSGISEELHPRGHINVFTQYTAAGQLATNWGSVVNQSKSHFGVHELLTIPLQGHLGIWSVPCPGRPVPNFCAAR